MLKPPTRFGYHSCSHHFFKKKLCDFPQWIDFSGRNYRENSRFHGEKHEKFRGLAPPPATFFGCAHADISIGTIFTCDRWMCVVVFYDPVFAQHHFGYVIPGFNMFIYHYLVEGVHNPCELVKEGAKERKLPSFFTT